ncbi:DUF2849 domain-containing protein [Consotaella salsifontis]|uniref:DUF2849 domain-containing protein n=1 Tax=Consotaella salsifontis TaxID=1365950 RepID=A0A1T4SDG7_9HYPH|nr:DUF2849 domain-containing protein [Consotaella salsifontis]SKA25918.1 Protein of unknown function [Consotaella salsifontis]
MAEATTRKTRGPVLPVVLSANDLFVGEVVYLTEDGWTADPRRALVAHDEAAAARLEERGVAAARENRVVDPYFVPVTIDGDGVPQARHIREAIRQRGPTIHPDIGKQADFKAA